MCTGSQKLYSESNTKCFPVMLTLLPHGREGKFLNFSYLYNAILLDSVQAKMAHQVFCMKTQSKTEFKTICFNFCCFLFFLEKKTKKKKNVTLTSQSCKSRIFCTKAGAYYTNW